MDDLEKIYRSLRIKSQYSVQCLKDYQASVSDRIKARLCLHFSASRLLHPQMERRLGRNWVRELEKMMRIAKDEEANKDALSYLKAGLAKLFLGGNKGGEDEMNQ